MTARGAHDDDVWMVGGRATVRGAHGDIWTAGGRVTTRGAHDDVWTAGGRATGRGAHDDDLWMVGGRATARGELNYVFWTAGDRSTTTRDGLDNVAGVTGGNAEALRTALRVDCTRSTGELTRRSSRML